jgi:NADH:ubiquinone oxidoreductase subunit E
LIFGNRLVIVHSSGTLPIIKIGFDYHENLTNEKVDKILEACR